MAITAFGFDGNLQEDSYARIERRGDTAAAFVARPTDLTVTAVPNQDRTVSIAAGAMVCAGALGVSDAAVTVSSPVVSGASRWDLIALLFDWTPDAAAGGGTVTPVVVPGTTTMALPASRATLEGYQFHAPLALVQYVSGQTQPYRIVDLRLLPDGGLARVADLNAAQILGMDTLVDRRSTSPALARLSDMQVAMTNASDGLVYGALVKRSATGTFRASNPVDIGDVTNKAYVDGAITTINNALTSTITGLTNRVPFGYANATVSDPYWGGYVGFAKIGPMVFVEVDLVRTSGDQVFNAWVPSLLASNLPKAATSNINNAEALTNQSETGYGFSMNGTSLNLVGRYTTKTFKVGGWVNGSFLYIAG